MIYIANILISLCLIIALWKIRRIEKQFVAKRDLQEQKGRILVQAKAEATNVSKKLQGVISDAVIKSALAEKMADRAFNMASTANLGVVALQKSLALPKIMTKQQAQQNQLAKEGVDKLFSGVGGFDWLRPLLSEEELDILDKAEQHKEKFNGIKE
jgi:hypothetical protein